MTVNATSTREFNVGQICRLAYQQAGLLSNYSKMDQQRGALARDFLDLILDSLPSKSTLSRSRTTVLVACTTGESTITIPSDVLDVNGDGAYIAAAETDLENPTFETTVRLVDQGEWHGTGNKSATGIPTRMYFDRSSDAPLLRLLPTPSESGHIRLKVRRLLADAGADSNTVDLERPWAQYLVYELGAKLALSSGMQGRSMYLHGLATAELRDCQGFSGERVGKQLTMGHRTGWSRR